jgi:sugar-specific transcriptional regulator TrmB
MKEILRKVGLGNEEIEIYFLLLKNSEMKATELSKELGVARSSCYRFLDNLLGKGLVSETIVNGVKFFIPVFPSRIPEILQERVEEVQEIVPKLKSMIGKKSEQAKVELYKGREGIKTIMNDIVKVGEDYTFFGEAEKFFSEIEFFTFSWIRKVEERKIKGRLLCSCDQNFEIAKTERVKFLKKELIPEITTWTYGNKTALFIWSEPIHAVLINNKSVTKGNKQLFDYFWKVAKLE